MKNKGFTLIEILVSVAIFSVVMVIALGALLAMSTADRKAESIKSVVDNLNFAIDSMSRAIRTGSNYNCNTSGGGNCLSGGTTLYFTPAGGGYAAYRLENTTNDASAGTVCNQTGTIGCIARSTSTSTDGINWSSWSAITAPEVVITNLNNILFYVRGSQAGSADSMQPIVTITLAGYAQVSTTEQSQFDVQTSVTQRIYDQ
ncbi:MAG: prepilin-type N-terminal cleavage/methylation domain-containing protein [Patescibacteria group bacterium]|nr:prepilin-type N-terminal cleavage/methylation domain-containing protein [Patescibacteria group bacterium]